MQAPLGMDWADRTVAPFMAMSRFGERGGVSPRMTPPVGDNVTTSGLRLWLANPRNSPLFDGVAYGRDGMLPFVPIH